jgi:hypothetical protein
VSRQRPDHALVQAVRAAGGSVRVVKGSVRVRLPVEVPSSDRPLLRLVLQHLVEGPAPTTRRRREPAA